VEQWGQCVCSEEHSDDNENQQETNPAVLRVPIASRYPDQSIPIERSRAYHGYRNVRNRLVTIQWGEDFHEGDDFPVDIAELKVFCINGTNVEWHSMSLHVALVCLGWRLYNDISCYVSRAAHLR